METWAGKTTRRSPTHVSRRLWEGREYEMSVDENRWKPEPHGCRPRPLRSQSHYRRPKPFPYQGKGHLGNE